MFGSVESIHAAVAAIRDAATSAPIDQRADVLAALLRGADASTAAATDLVARDGIQAAAGRPADHVMRHDAGYVHSDAAMVSQAAAALSRMPALREAFDHGLVSWGQVRAIVVSLRRTASMHWGIVDDLIAEHAKRLAGAESDRLIALVDQQIARLRPDLVVAREDRAIAGSFLAVQSGFDGSAAFYGVADPVSAAIIIDALDAVADDPVHPDAGISRAQQRMTALVHLSEMSLAGQSAGVRPRPRLLATLDIAALTDSQRDDALRLLWALQGRAPRLSRVTRDQMLCDSRIVPIIFNGPTVIAVGDETAVFSDKVRAAIVARDRQCRMCGRAPASWSDAHHLRPGKGNAAEDGCLLCRRCHRSVHRAGWAITWQDHGVLRFQRRGKHFLSHPP